MESGEMRHAWRDVPPSSFNVDRVYTHISHTTVSELEGGEVWPFISVNLDSGVDLAHKSTGANEAESAWNKQ